MSATIIDGRSLAAKIKKEIKEEIKTLGTTPGLAVILVGEDYASHIYVQLKERASSEVGIHFEKFLYPSRTSQSDILKKVEELNRRSDIHAILVQLPLPEGLDEDEIIRAINPEKDADGFHPDNLAQLKTGNPSVIPGVSLAILKLIESTKVILSGKQVVLLVNSTIFADPLSYLFARRGAHQKVVLSNASDIISKTNKADILVVAIGKPRYVTEEMVKRGAVVIDVGTTRVMDKIVGDVDFERVKQKAAWISPVPGGVGPLTVAMLLKNVVALAKKKENPLKE